MLKPITALLAAALVAGCTSTGGSSSSGATAVAAAPAAASAQDMTGTWRGTLGGGAAVQVRISDGGSVAYAYNGQNVPVTATRVSGRSLVLTVGSGGGQVTLTPAGDRLNYRYSFRGDQASAILTRA